MVSDRRAAVALLLYEDGAECSVLLMRRSDSPQDPWSGQVCLPGGKEDATDGDLVATACRETREEVGVDLERCSRYLGALNDVPAVARGKQVGTVISPHVFITTERPEIRLGPEAAFSFWLSLELASQGQLDSQYAYQSAHGKLLLPCWRSHEQVVWGLTYKMLRSLLLLATRHN